MFAVAELAGWLCTFLTLCPVLVLIAVIWRERMAMQKRIAGWVVAAMLWIIWTTVPRGPVN